MFLALSELKKHFHNNDPPRPGSIGFINDKIKLLRAYFGEFLYSGIMGRPLYNGIVGSCLRVNTYPDKGLLWYFAGENFTIVSFIDLELKESSFGVKKLITSFNSKNIAYKLGAITLPEFDFILPIKNSVYKTELKIAAGKFQNSDKSFQETKNLLALLHQVSPKLLIYCYVSKDYLVDSIEHRNQWLFYLFKVLLIVGFAGYTFSLRNKLGLTIKSKMILLFLFVNGLPILILVSIGYEFFAFKKKAHINSVHQESIQIIKDLDAWYEMEKTEITDLLNKKISSFEEKNGLALWPKKELDKLKSFIKTLAPSEFIIINEKGHTITSAGTNIDLFAKNSLQKLLGGALEYYNSQSQFSRDKGKIIFQGFSCETDFFQGFLNAFSNTTVQSFGSDKRWAYLRLLGDRKNLNSWGILVASWEFELFQRIFLNRKLEKINKSIFPRKLIVMESGSEKIFPARFENESHLIKLLRRTHICKVLKANMVNYQGKPFIATSIMGNSLSKAAIMVLTPESTILNEIEQLKINIIAAVILGGISVFFIIWFFSGNMIAPLNSLEKGIDQISQRNFRYRINHSAANEFGDLINTFNETIAGMGELELAGTVQNGLLPKENWQKGKFCSLWKISFHE